MRNNSALPFSCPATWAFFCPATSNCSCRCRCLPRAGCVARPDLDLHLCSATLVLLHGGISSATLVPRARTVVLPQLDPTPLQCRAKTKCSMPQLRSASAPMPLPLLLMALALAPSPPQQSRLNFFLFITLLTSLPSPPAHLPSLFDCPAYYRAFSAQVHSRVTSST